MSRRGSWTLGRLLFALSCAVPRAGGAEICQFDASVTYVCNAVGDCTPDPTGCSGGNPTPDDFWDVGSGVNEYVRVAVAGATGGTFTLGFAGGTSAPIPFALGGVPVEAGLLSIPGVERSDFALTAHGTGFIDWYWTGDFGCQDAPDLTCDGSGLSGPFPSCTVSVLTPGVAPTGAPVLRIQGPWTQDASPGAGLRVRCDAGLVVDAPTGNTLTLGKLGLVLDHGSASVVRGGIRGPMAAHTPPHTAEDTWTVTGIENCPGGDCALRRLRFGERAPMVGSMLDAVAAPGDVVWFPLGGSSMDEGFWYDVAARDGDASPPWLDLDTRQSKTNSIGWSLAQKGITPGTLAADVIVGDTSLALVDGTIAADDDFVGMCVYVAGHPHLVKRTRASADTVDLVREDGARTAAAAGGAVHFSTSCHRVLDEVVVAAPIRIRSATTGTAPAEQEDMPVTVRGEIAWDWVVVEGAGGAGLLFDQVQGTLDHVWSRDRPVQTFAARFYNTRDQEIGSLQLTGAADLDGATSYGDCANGVDCQAHGLGLGGSVGNTLAWVGQRHVGDDCLVGFHSRGLTDNDIQILRCQQRLGAVQSMECVSGEEGVPVTRVGTLECLKATGRGAGFFAGGNTFGGNSLTRLRIDSAFTLYGYSLGSSTVIGDFQNLYALRNERPDSANSPFFAAQSTGMQTLRSFLLDEPAGSTFFRLFGGCQQLSDGIVLRGSLGAEVGVNYVTFSSAPPCPHGLPTIDNVGLVDFDVQDALGTSSVAVSGIRNGSTGLLRNLLVYWAERPPDLRPDHGVTDSGTLVESGAQVSHLAIVGWNGATGHAFDFQPTSAAVVAAGAGAYCFADNVRDYPEAIAASLPAGTVVGPRPEFLPHTYVAAPGSAWDQAGCGLRGSPGICTTQRWHQWEDVPLRQTCYGALLDACGNAEIELGEACDDGNAADGDGCSAACEAETSLALAGYAIGGSVEVAVYGVPVAVVTVPGQTAADVVAALAAAIGAHPTLVSFGVYALAQGDSLVSNGALGGLASTDEGIGEAVALIGALSWAGAALLAAAIALAGARSAARRR